LEHSTESTARQYDLVNRAVTLGWDRSRVLVVDADLGVSGSVIARRGGFEQFVADIALGQVGIIVALEVSRLARDNTAWYRPLDLAGTCDQLADSKCTRAGLHHGEREHRTDHVGQPGQAVAAADQDVPQPAVAQVGEHLGPELDSPSPIHSPRVSL